MVVKEAVENVKEYIINNDLKDINEEKIYNWIIENIFK